MLFQLFLSIILLSCDNTCTRSASEAGYARYKPIKVTYLKEKNGEKNEITKTVKKVKNRSINILHFDNKKDIEKILDKYSLIMITASADALTEKIAINEWTDIISKSAIETLQKAIAYSENRVNDIAVSKGKTETAFLFIKRGNTIDKDANPFVCFTEAATISYNKSNALLIFDADLDNKHFIRSIEESIRDNFEHIDIAVNKKDYNKFIKLFEQ